jgi:hypothetical protein
MQLARRGIAANQTERTHPRASSAQARAAVKDRSGRNELPAAATGQKEADEEVVLRV